MGTRGTAIAEKSSDRVRLKVLYDFEYETLGKQIRIVKDERLLLLKRTNNDWWQVVRPADLSSIYVPEQSTFYVPTGYIVEEDILPDSTRFYITNDKMIKQQNEITTQVPVLCQQHSNQEEVQQVQETCTKDEPRKAHESFRNVIRKLSGNLSSINDSSKSTKPTKSSKMIKNLRKNSVGSNEDVKIFTNKCSLVPLKPKDSWDSSPFGMCFGRDMKNSDAQALNPFQEELENALSNRISQKKIVLNPKLGINKQVNQVSEEKEKTSKFENIQDKWEKASAQILKKPDNFHFVSLTKIKEDALKKQNTFYDYQKSELTNDTSFDTKNLLEPGKILNQSKNDSNKSLQQSNKIDASNTHIHSTVSEINDENVIQESLKKQDIDRLLINDKRKMWAIETLMSELLESSINLKPVGSIENNQRNISGPNQLAQELHEMSISRRFENDEIQMNLLDNKHDYTKENKQLNNNNKYKIEPWKRKIFDFPPCSNVMKTPKSPTTRSPKLLDEYNEANILNDNDRPREIKGIPVELLDYESPSYSNISMCIKREKVPCKLNMPIKDFREELQLTPSLEKLASEIKFLPASAISVESENEKHSIDLDCPTTTLSQDSLRLYKRRSKSDGALNKRDPRRRDSVDSQRGVFEVKFNQQQQQLGRKYTQNEMQRGSSGLKHNVTSQEYCYRVERGSQAMRHKLNRKSRSLGDLDCSEMEEDRPDDEAREPESRRRYKPVPKLRSKESFRKIKPFIPLIASAASTERLAPKPVPAKRRIQQNQKRQPYDSSYDDLSEIDIERSTAVGFKTLLRTSDSGSEEYLQYKTFPATVKPQQLSYEQSRLVGVQSISRSDGNVNLTRSHSDEVILSSTSCSSASPSHLLDGSIENLVNLPFGWTQAYDNNVKRLCFINERGDKWFSSNDSEGKIYFFEENSNESSWALPTVINENRVRTISNGDWPQLFDGNMCILKEGMINKTKITTENGKKLRKTWSTSYAVLTELFLLFFKDAKTFAAMKMDQSATAKPDISVDLNGAFIESSEKLSNRKNVYLINTLLGLQVLIQWDNAFIIAEWYREIHDAIQRLPFSQEYGKSSSSRE
ncbi:PREDICTED: uncharacterized protein LOC105365413 [Ceratosolen solmsi marchali]|uniref:Uncharacterized protein LOC105365413 n=1 Tax=Ceratosolen solmsi marchali TaxID=326594 RepID=A0AAJ6YPJ2_9HYME|nr:PREDICTED: uncharacterized protein LOC105365413 [Ceratosolen solmsi marchali]